LFEIVVSRWKLPLRKFENAGVSHLAAKKASTILKTSKTRPISPVFMPIKIQQQAQQNNYINIIYIHATILIIFSFFQVRRHSCLYDFINFALKSCTNPAILNLLCKRSPTKSSSPTIVPHFNIFPFIN